MFSVRHILEIDLSRAPQKNLEVVIGVEMEERSEGVKVVPEGLNGKVTVNVPAP